MALHWDISDITDYKTLCWTPAKSGKVDEETGEPLVDLDPITDGLIWATMMTGIGTIKQSNYEEFWLRLEMQSILGGSYMNWGPEATWHGQPKPDTKSGYSLEMVYRHIGLSTNASFRDETRNKWFKRVIAPKIAEQAGWKLKQQRELLAEFLAESKPTVAAPQAATVTDGKIVVQGGGD